MKRNKIIYWTSTGILSALFTFSAIMYFINYSYVESAFTSLGFPTWIIYPLATLKLLGIIAILSKKSLFLKELAYAGFLFDALLALIAHLAIGDGEQIPAVIGVIAVTTSWIYDRKVFGKYTQTCTKS